MIVTPNLRGGSWIFLRQLIEETYKEIEFIVLGLGQSESPPTPGTTWLALPYLSYDISAFKLAKHPVASILFEFPVLIMAFLMGLLYRPNLIIGNGIIATVGCLPAAKVIRSPLILSHRGLIEGFVKGGWLPLARRLLRQVDLAFVNSEASAEDLRQAFERTKVEVVPHWAEDLFFARGDRETARRDLGFDGSFVVAFVGRIDSEKQCHILLDAVRKTRNQNMLCVFAGRGALEKQIERASKEDRRIRWMGYLSDRRKLRDLYMAADIVWAYADETYLARPAVEALACGTPIVMTNIPAVLTKAEAGIVIENPLFPADLGYMVEPDAGRISKLFERLSQNPSGQQAVRRRCAEYAARNFTKARSFGGLLRSIEAML